MVATHRLHRGDLAVEVSLQGGGIQRFARGGQTLMCPAPTAPYLACFAMLPFCSRINTGRFQYGEHEVALAPNFPPEPHAIHGFGWQGLWQLDTQDEHGCVLVYEHDGAASDDTGWPWTFRASQRLTLSDSGLWVTLTLENLSNDVMPAGMGLHPHFPLAVDMRVSMACADRVVMTDGLLPTLEKLDDHGEVNPLADRPWLRRVWMMCLRIAAAAFKSCGQTNLGRYPLSPIQCYLTGSFMRPAVASLSVSNRSAICQMPSISIR